MSLLQTLPAARASTPPLIDRPGRELERTHVSAGDGLSLAFAGLGAGTPVVLIHGVLTCLEDMIIALGGTLASRYRVLAFDRPGCGRSASRRFVDAGFWRQARALNRALEAMEVQRPVLVGHSFGASVALAMALDRPERVGGVVAIAPLGRPEIRLEHALFGPRATPFVGDLIGMGARETTDRSLLPLLWRAMYLPQEMPREVETEFPFALAGRSDCGIRIGEDALAAGPDLVRLLAAAPRCTVPVRILGGDRDLVVRNGQNGRLLAALMPEARFVDLPGLGHMAHHFAVQDVAAAVDELAAPSRG